MLAETPLFDEFGMPSGETGARIYRDLMEQVASHCSTTPAADLALFEVVNPWGTRVLLRQAGRDLEDVARACGLPWDSPLVGFTVRRNGTVEQSLDELWGLSVPREVGALVAARFHDNESGAGLRGLVLVARSGFRGVLTQSPGGVNRVQLSFPAEPPPEQFTTLTGLLERALGCQGLTPPAQVASVSLKEFIALDVAAGAAEAALGCRDEGMPSDMVLLVAFAVALVRMLRMAVSLSGEPASLPTKAMEDVLSDMAGSYPGNPSPAKLADAFHQCTLALDQDWVQVLGSPSGAELFSKILPSTVVRNPSWGGAQLIGTLLARSLNLSEARRLLEDLAPSSFECIASVLNAGGLAMPSAK